MAYMAVKHRFVPYGPSQCQNLEVCVLLDRMAKRDVLDRNTSDVKRRTSMANWAPGRRLTRARNLLSPQATRSRACQQDRFNLQRELSSSRRQLIIALHRLCVGYDGTGATARLGGYTFARHCLPLHIDLYLTSSTLRQALLFLGLPSSYLSPLRVPIWRNLAGPRW